MSTVGKISIRVFPDTSKLRSELKTSLERIENKVKGKVNVEVELDRASLAKMRATLKALNEVIHLNAEADIRHAKEKLQELKEDLDVTVNADADTGAANASLMRLARDRIANIRVNLTGLTAANTALMALAGGNVLKKFGTGIKDLFTNFDTIAMRTATMGTALTSLLAVAGSAAGGLFTLGSSLAAMAPAALALPGIFAGVGVGVGVMVAALKDAGTYLGHFKEDFSAIQDSISGAFWERAAEPLQNLVQSVLPILSQRLTEIGSELGGVFAAVSNAAAEETSLKVLDGALQNLRDSINIAGDGFGSFTAAMVRLTGVGSAYLPGLASAFNEMSYSFEAWINKNTDSGQIFAWIDSGLQQLKYLGSALGAVGGIFASIARAANAAGGGGLKALADNLQAINEVMKGPAFQGALTTFFAGAAAGTSALMPGIKAIGGAFETLAPTIAYAMETAGKTVSIALGGISSALSNPAFGAGIKALFAGILVAVDALAPAFTELGPVFGALASAIGQMVSQLAPVIAQIISGLAPAFTQLVQAMEPVITALTSKLSGALEFLIPIIQNVITWVAGFMEQFPGLSATILIVVAAVGLFIAAFIGIVTAVAPVVSALAPIVTALAAVLSVTAAVAAGWIAAGIAIVAAVIALVVAIVANWDTIKEWTVSTWNAIVEAITAAWEWIVQAISTGLQAVSDFFTNGWAALVEFVTTTWENIGLAIQTAWENIVLFVQTGIQAVSDFFTNGWAALVEFVTTTWENIGLAIQLAWTFITAAVSAGIAAVVQFFIDLPQTLYDLVVNGMALVLAGMILGITWLVQTVTEGIENIKTFFVEGWAFITETARATWEAIPQLIAAGWEWIKTTIANGIQAAIEFVTTGWESIRSTSQAIWEALPILIAAAWEIIKARVSAAVENLKTMITTGFEAAKQFAIDAVNGLKDGVVNGFNTAKDMAITAVTSLRDMAVNAFNALRDGVSNAIENIKTFITNGFTTAKQIATDMVSQLAQAVSQKIQEVVGFFRELPGKIVSAIGNAAQMLYNVGADIIRGMINGIKGMAGAVADAIGGVVGDVKQRAKNLLGIKSPSRVFRQIGVYTGEGFAQGIEKMTGKAQTAVENMVAVPTANIPPINHSATTATGTGGMNTASSYDNGNALASIAEVLNRLEEVDPRSFMMMKRRAERLV